MGNLNLDERFLRQVEIADPKKLINPVFILGLGSIGSASAIALAKMGTPQGLTFLDFDLFEEHNIPNQLCLEKAHKGQLKVSAMAELCRSMGHVGQIKELPLKLLGEDLVDLQGEVKGKVKNYLNGIVLSLPDSMVARKDLWSCCKYNPKVKGLIDVRVAGRGQYIVIYSTGVMSSQDIKRYESTLYNDDQASQDPCGARGVIFTTLIAGGLVASLVRQLHLEMPIPTKITLDTTNLTLEVTYPNGKVVNNASEIALALVG